VSFAIFPCPRRNEANKEKKDSAQQLITKCWVKTLNQQVKPEVRLTAFSVTVLSTFLMTSCILI
jgi:hypothetical protein